MKRIFYFTICLLIVGCGSRRIKSTSDTKETETIIFGKVILKSNRELSNKRILMHFNERRFGKNAVWLDENGYFYMKIPLGTNHIALLEYREEMGYFKNILKDYCSVNVPYSDKVYYVGDITFDWTPSKSDERQTGTGIFNGIQAANEEASQKGEKLPALVKNSQSTVEYFKKKFPENRKEIITELITIN